MIRKLNVAAAGAVAAFSLAVALGGCSTTLGRNFDAEYAQQIKAGETTKEQVLGKLGRPPLRKATTDEETWTYAYYTGPGYFFYWLGASDDDLQYGLGKQKRLIVVFKGDVVKSTRFTQEIPLQ